MDDRRWSFKQRFDTGEIPPAATITVFSKQKLYRIVDTNLKLTPLEDGTTSNFKLYSASRKFVILLSGSFW